VTGISIPERPATVFELTRRIRETLEDAFGTVWVVGEASNVRRPSSGHVYLTLKDDRAQIAAVMWRSMASRLPFELRDGLEVIVQGELTVYEPRGQYQVILRHIQPKGVGALQLAFLQLKEKLEAEGLFDPDRKRPLPFLPRRIGIVTSPTGAAIRDMLRTIYDRFPGARVLLRPASVQGEGAAEAIAEGLADLNTVEDVDVIIVGRGGGSLEDLWAFNEEIVARAIAASGVPVVSGVGHEIDITISDLVADRRALTPTDAGRLVTPDMSQLRADLDAWRERMANALRRRVGASRERLDGLGRSYAFRRPLDRVRLLEQRVDELCQRLARSARTRLRLIRGGADGLAARLAALSPEGVLARGYSITMRPNGSVLTSIENVKIDARIRTRLRDGEFTSKVLTAGKDHGQSNT